MMRVVWTSLRHVDGIGTTRVFVFLFFLLFEGCWCPRSLRWLWGGTFTWVFNNKLFRMFPKAFATFDNNAILSVRVKVLLKVRHLFEAFWAVEDRAQVGFLSCVSPHVVKQAFNALKEFSTISFIAWVVGYCLRNQVRTILILRQRIVQTSLESKLTE